MGRTDFTHILIPQLGDDEPEADVFFLIDLCDSAAIVLLRGSRAG